jgi:outer membrane protein TolC
VTRLRTLAAMMLLGLAAAAAPAQEAPMPPQAPTPTAPAAGAALTLEEALALAARNNETAGIAQARLERAEAIKRQAYSAFWPALTATGTYTRRSEEVVRIIDGEEITSQAKNAFQTLTILDVPIFDARAFPVARATERSLEAQQQESQELVRTLTFDTSEAFFAVLSLERLVEAARRRLEVAQAVVSDAETRLDAGLASRNELTRTDLERAQARLALTVSQNSVQINRLRLEYLIGADVPARLEEPGPLFSGPRDLAELTRQARAYRPDLIAAEKRAEAARLLAKEPTLRWIPRLDGTATYRTTNEPGLSGKESDWNAGALLTWELFDGGERYAEAAARRAEHRDLVLQSEALRRQIGVDVERAGADLDTAEAGVKQAEVAVSVARQNEEEVRVRFQEGLATALEQADASVSAFEAEAVLAQQRFALYVAQLALLRTTGGWPLGAPPPTAPIMVPEPEPERAP